MGIHPGLTSPVLREVWTGSGLTFQERHSSILAPPLTMQETGDTQIWEFLS